MSGRNGKHFDWLEKRWINAVRLPLTVWCLRHLSVLRSNHMFSPFSPTVPSAATGCGPEVTPAAAGPADQRNEAGRQQGLPRPAGERQPA